VLKSCAFFVQFKAGRELIPWLNARQGRSRAHHCMGEAKIFLYLLCGKAGSELFPARSGAGKIMALQVV
jgi:hypothetical protein